MMPTIRIDNEVYAWLQEHARPLEDTPNSVLRRIAQLDGRSADKRRGTHASSAPRNGTSTATRSQRQNVAVDRKSEQITGKQLNAEWNVGALHALYHQDGTWYNNLTQFPGALFDPQGFIFFATEEDYRNCRFLKITEQTNVRDGISEIPEYIRKL